MGDKFEEVAFETGVALTEDGGFISGMGLDFRDFNNDGYPDIVFVALNNQTFPIFQNTGKGSFREVTTESGMRDDSLSMTGFGAALYDFDNDGWKDFFISGGHVQGLSMPGTTYRPLQHRLPKSGSERKVATPHRGGGIQRRPRRLAIADARSLISMATAASTSSFPHWDPTPRSG